MEAVRDDFVGLTGSLGSALAGDVTPLASLGSFLAFELSFLAVAEGLDEGVDMDGDAEALRRMVSSKG